MALLDENMVNQLKEVFKRIDKEIKIVNFVSESNDKSKELQSFLDEFKAVSDKIIIENNIPLAMALKYTKFKGQWFYHLHNP